MDKRRTLKVSITPDTSIIPPSDDTLIFETPRPKAFVKKSVPSEPPLTFIKPTHSATKFYIAQLLLVAAVLYGAFLCTHKKDTAVAKTVQELLSQTSEIHTKLARLEAEIGRNKMVENYAGIEKGACIDYESTSPAHRYGLLGRSKAADAAQILMGHLSDCFAFTGSAGRVGIKLGEAVFIKEIVVVHPVTGDRRSAMKDFEVYGIGEEPVLLGKFVFGFENIRERFVVDSRERFGKVLVVVRSNHGKAAYTCIYSIQVLGHQ